MARRWRRHSYDYLRCLIQQSLEDCPGFGGCVEVEGKINRIAEGLWHDNYWFWIQGRDLSAAQTEHAYILRLLERRYDWQEGPEPRDRLVREAKTLQVFKRTDFVHPTWMACSDINRFKMRTVFDDRPASRAFVP